MDFAGAEMPVTCVRPAGIHQARLAKAAGKSEKISTPIDCETVNVIYKIICRKCPSFVYVGETQRKAKERFYQHRSYVMNKKTDTPTGSHFNGKGHSVNDLQMIPFERVRPANNP